VRRRQLPGLRDGQETAARRGRSPPAPAAIQAADALRAPPRGLTSFNLVYELDSFCLRIALTCEGLALPLVAAITLPTSALNAFSLPALYSATIGAFAAITSSTILPIAPASEICFRPRATMIASASPPHSPAHIAAKTSLATLWLIVPLNGPVWAIS